MTTPGELLARKLRGDKSVTKADIDKATVDYFAANGVRCTIEDAPAERLGEAGNVAQQA